MTDQHQKRQIQDCLSVLRTHVLQYHVESTERWRSMLKQIDDLERKLNHGEQEKCDQS